LLFQALSLASVVVSFESTSSTYVFHSWQCGHLPIHLGEVAPQLVHAKIVLILANLIVFFTLTACINTIWR